MIVKSLSVQHLGQFSFLSVTFLQFCSFVLEPDLDLILVQPEFSGEMTPSLLCQVSVAQELLPQFVELLRAEGSPGSLLVVIDWSNFGANHGAGLLHFLDFPDPGPGGRSVRVSGAEDPGWPQLTIWTSHHSWRTVLVCLGSLVGGLREINWNLHVNLSLFCSRAVGFVLFWWLLLLLLLLAPQGRSGQFSLWWWDGSWPGDGPRQLLEVWLDVLALLLTPGAQDAVYGEGERLGGVRGGVGGQGQHGQGHVEEGTEKERVGHGVWQRGGWGGDHGA